MAEKHKPDVTAMQRRAKARRDARATLESVAADPGSSPAQKIAASRALLLDTRSRARKKQARPADVLTGQDIAEMRQRVRAESGLELFAERRGDENFVEEFRHRAERSLYFFAKFSGVAPDLTPEFHKGVCAWLQAWPEPGDLLERIKLFMMPTQHLKTAVASHGLPLHMVIQPKERNLYFPNRLGRDLRIALVGESSDKAEENLSVLEGHLEHNPWIRACWPACCWQDVSKAPKWSQKFATVPRDVIKGEPTFTALGVGTKLYQRHYDFIDCDDIIGWDAAGSRALMDEINEWRKGLLTRRHSPMESLMLFIGTHFTPTDIYVRMKEELPKAAVISRSVIENGVPLWPERFPINVIEQNKRQLGPRLFAHLMMNLPTAEGFTGFDWNQVRLFEWDTEPGLLGSVRIIEDELDDEIRAIYADPIAQIVSRWKKGAPLSALYPQAPGRPFVDPYDEKSREEYGRLSAAQQFEMKQMHYLRGKYGERGPFDGEFPLSGGDGGSEQGQNTQGFDTVTFRDRLLGAGRDREGVPTTRLRRANPN